MPVRIPVVYPRYPRIYPRRAAAARGAAPARGRRGALPPGSIDTSSTGNVGGDLAKAISNTIQANQMNAAANQLMNTQTPPRAAWVGGAAPAAGVPTTGTAPQTGGSAELQFRQQQAADEAAQRTADLNEQYKRAQLAHTLAQTGEIGRKAALPGKPGKYVAGSGDVQNDPSTDNFNQIQADFDAQHGKGSYGAFTRNFSNLKPDGKGNLVLQDDQGNTLMGKDGVTPQYSIPASDAPYWIDRYNAARIRGGQGRLGAMPDGTNPNSGQPGGSSQVNPIAVTTNLQARALPDGTWIQLPDGSTRQITRSAAQAQPAATAGTVSAAPPEEPSTDQTETDQSEEEQNG